jgi:hypothetical protein
MVNLEIDKDNREIVLTSDDPSVVLLLEKEEKITEFIPWKKRWGTVIKKTKLYEDRKPKITNGIITLRVKFGFAAYLINVFKNFISQECFEDIINNTIYSPNYRNLPFQELRDYQNEDVLHVLKYRLGLFSVYTSYGKTQVISVLANYFYTQGKKVLIVAPGKKPKDELVKRCKSLYNLDIPNSDLSINCMITSGLLNRKDVKDPVELRNFEKLLSSYEVVLVDEVEYTMNESGKFLFDRLKGAEIMYAFSGTADKEKGELISFTNGISDVITRNRDLVSYFGPSLVHRVPLTMKIDNITVLTSALDNIVFDKAMNTRNNNVYQEVSNKIWTDPGICRLIVKIAKRFPKLFIPINNLVSVIDNWIDNYFKGVFNVLLVCGEGYIYYDKLGNKTKIDLNEACNKIKNGEVDIIPSTSAGYRALDFPNLENILLIQGKVAGVVLQSGGRVCRGNHANIISIDSITGKKIPLYSKTKEYRTDLFNSYYKYCDITESTIYEFNL